MGKREFNNKAFRFDYKSWIDHVVALTQREHVVGQITIMQNTEFEA